MKPIIGVIGRPDVLDSGNEVFYINVEINEAILKNGGIAIMIPPNIVEKFIDKNINNTKKMNDIEFKELKEIINMCDGIVCQGGNDFYDYDLRIIEYCYQIDKPLFGICLGMQTMAYLFNGEMKDFSNLTHKSKAQYVHEVKIDNKSKLYNILKENVIKVNSRHKSFINNTSLNIVALTSDNIIEAVEDRTKKFFIGVQWHPESMIEYDMLENKLFSYFIECCRG